MQVIIFQADMLEKGIQAMKVNLILVNDIIVAEEKNKKKALKLLSFFKAQNKNTKLMEVVIGD